MEFDLVEGLIVGLVALGGWLVRAKYEEARREREQLQSERRDLYVKILEPFIHALASVKNPAEGKKAQEKILSFEHRKAAVEFNIIGSDDVVNVFNEFMQFFYGLDENSTTDPKEIINTWGRLILAIRRDLGNKNTKLKEVDMLKSWITDIDKFI